MHSPEPRSQLPRDKLHKSSEVVILSCQFRQAMAVWGRTNVGDQNECSIVVFPRNLVILDVGLSEPPVFY